jgi:hypothetical protein
MTHNPQASTTEKIAAYCAQLHMDPDEPLRALLMTLAVVLDANQHAAAKTGREAAQIAGQAAAAEARLQFARMARDVSWMRRIIVGGGLLVAFAAGYAVARAAPTPTFAGRMTAAQIETMRYNDLGSLLANCQEQAPRDGRKWCSFTAGWWLSPPPPPR